MFECVIVKIKVKSTRMKDTAACTAHQRETGQISSYVDKNLALYFTEKKIIHHTSRSGARIHDPI
jgi:hypothetical protein